MKNFLIIALAGFLTIAPAMAAEKTLSIKAGSSWGKVKNSQNTIASRSLATHEFSAQPGLQFDEWTLGLSLGWRFRRQLTEPAEVANTNLRGGGYNAGLMAKYDMENWSALGVIDLSANYGLSNKDPLGQEIKYKCVIGICGIGATAQTKIWNEFLLEAGFKYQRWGRVDVNGVDNDIRKARLSEWRVYLGTGMDFLL